MFLVYSPLSAAAREKGINWGAIKCGGTEQMKSWFIKWKTQTTRELCVLCDKTNWRNTEKELGDFFFFKDFEETEFKVLETF